MARSPANLITAAALLGLPATGLALGLGDIQLKSALNQPLDARIEILGASPQDLRDLHAAIAGRDTFTRYGLDYPQSLGSLRFSVEKDAEGRDVLRVTSPQPVTEPFITFLVEADWTRGRLLREYTMLLDPPVFMPEPAAPLAVEAPRGVAAQPAPGAGSIEREVEATPSVEPVPPVETTTAAQPTRPSPAATAAPIASGDYQVRRGDTLWVIASRTRPDSSTSLNQMMVALYRANPDAFLGNMNLLKANATLHVPAADELTTVPDGEAAAEFARQTAEWQGGAPARAQVNAEDQLKLVPPKAGGEVPSTAATQSGASGATGEAVSRVQQQNTALSAQVKDLQTKLDEANSRLQVKDSELAQMQKALADAGKPAAAISPPATATGETGVELETPQPSVAETPSVAVPPAQTGEAEQRAIEPAPEVAAPVTPAEPQKSWLDSLLGLFTQTWVWVALGVALVLAAVGVALKRRKSVLAPIDALEREAAPTRARSAPTVQPLTVVDAPAASKPRSAASPASSTSTSDTGSVEITGTFRPVDFDTGLESSMTSSGEISYPFEDSATGIDQADPISEADFHLAYGLYDQAAELVKKALDREPGRHDLQLKLLEILFMWGNRDAFRERAQAFRAELIRAGKWDSIIVMGKQLCPGDALFEPTGAPPMDQTVDLDLAVTGEMKAPLLRGRSDDTPALDFDLDDALSARADLHAAQTVPATGEYLEMIKPKDSEDVEVHDEELTAVARRLEARMRPRAGDVGVALDLGETIAPEDVSATRTLSDTKTKKTDDDAFGDFFAFTGVAEAPEPDPTGTREIVLDFEGDMLPDSTTAEFKIELPEDGSEIDFDLGATGANLPTLRDDSIDGDTTRVLAQGGDTTILSNFNDTETMQAPGFVDSTARTVQAPGLDDEFGDFDMLGNDDATVSAATLDLDVGGGGGGGGEGERHGTVRVSAADLALPEAEDGVLDEVGTKLDLARAYIDMGDPDGARSILEEVIEEGDESQRQNANTLLRSIA